MSQYKQKKGRGAWEGERGRETEREGEGEREIERGGGERFTSGRGWGTRQIRAVHGRGRSGEAEASAGAEKRGWAGAERREQR